MNDAPDTHGKPISATRSARTNAKKNKPTKEQAENIERLKENFGQLSEKLNQWTAASDLRDLDKLFQLVAYLGQFFRVTTPSEKEPDENSVRKYSSLESTLTCWINQYGTQRVPSSDQQGGGNDSGASLSQVQQAVDQHLSPSSVTPLTGEEGPVLASSAASRVEVQKKEASGEDFSKAIAEARRDQQKLMESVKKQANSTASVHGLVEEQGKTILMIKSRSMQTATADALESGLSSILAAIQNLHQGLGSIQAEIGGLKNDVLLSHQQLASVQSGIKVTQETIDGKISVADAHKVLEYREMVERQVRAATIQAVSREILLPLVALKHATAGQTGEVASAIEALGERCRRIGLSID